MKSFLQWMNETIRHDTDINGKPLAFKTTGKLKDYIGNSKYLIQQINQLVNNNKVLEKIPIYGLVHVFGPLVKSQTYQDLNPYRKDLKFDSPADLENLEKIAALTAEHLNKMYTKLDSYKNIAPNDNTTDLKKASVRAFMAYDNPDYDTSHDKEVAKTALENIQYKIRYYGQMLEKIESIDGVKNNREIEKQIEPQFYRFHQGN